jgi:3-oxoacyl-[acyl-carrier protein] reductase
MGVPVTLDFSDSVAVITGGGGGIAAATARLLARSGATVVIGDIDRRRVEALAESLVEEGGDAVALELDTTDVASIERFLAVARDRGGIDLLVPAAGVYPEAPIAEISDEQWRTVIDINLDGVFKLVRRALPLMRDGGSIVTVASVAGHRGSRLHAHYAASKAGLIAFTRSLALEAGDSLRINAVSPGTIDTPMIRDLVQLRGDELISETPLNRYGRADEVASAIAFLASDAASYVHGEVLHVNGGLFMAG